jgi:AcrR family transcriptional regulator
MGDVAEAAEVSYGLIYHYFARKEALYQALVAQSLRSADMAFEHLGQIPGTPGQRLDLLVSRLVENRRDHPQIAQLHYQVLRDEVTPDALRERALRHSQAVQETLRRLIVEGQATAEVRAADPDQLVNAVLAVLDGLTRLMLISPERLRAHFPDADIILGMLRSPTYRASKSLPADQTNRQGHDREE